MIHQLKMHLVSVLHLLLKSNLLRLLMMTMRAWSSSRILLTTN
jgi:hypothetical protein